MKLDYQVQRVYAEHGAAMAEAQLLESYLGHLLFAARASGGANSSDPKNRIVSKPNLGQLIGNLVEVFPVPLSFQTRLDSARLNRNRLAHSYFSKRAEAFQTRAGRAKMIRELDQIGEEFYALWGQIDAAIVAWLCRRLRTNEALIADFNRAVGEA